MIQSVFGKFVLLALTWVLFDNANAMGAGEAAQRRRLAKLERERLAKLESENVNENNVNLIDQPDEVPEAQGNVI